MNETITYYNNNATKFKIDTIDANMSEIQNKFLDYLRKGSYILDFGCGSGRDTKFFIDNGYIVDSTDGSIEMCNVASYYVGVDVKHMYFHELDEKNKYDGVWACSSILHLSYEDLLLVLSKIHLSLKEEGVLYTSFKYGDDEGIRNGRHFTDMNETKIIKLLGNLGFFSIEELWVANDVRVDRGDEKWLNVILRK